jgi:hypothetical protein
MQSVSREVATEEVDGWLDFKGVRSRKRESNKEYIEQLIEGVEDGYLSVDEDHNIHFELAQAMGNDNDITKLVFKPKMKVKDYHPHLKNVKPGDSDGRMMAYICGLTGKNSGIITQLDTEDLTIATNIAVFFF